MTPKRAAAVCLYFAGVMTGCGSSEPPPIPTGGPAFVINNPVDGSSMAGVAWFSVQPANPAEVARVQFTAGDQDLGADVTPADGFRVFVAAKDYPAGPLALEATVTGTDGRISTRSVSVTNVPDPPSTATVGAGGTVLGAAEVDGAISTLTIAPGDATGATVTFATRTKDEVKTATGVDYDALGVTFLGAQEIGSTKRFEKPLLVSSGGFGPRVQPGQVVVQYRIAPDADGDGKGELVVVNTASVAPNGDVISDPIVQAMAISGGAGSGGGHAASPSGGPPGTLLQFSVTGFNPNSTGGNIAIWSCATGVTARITGTVLANGPSGAQVFHTIIPACPPGPATVTLFNASTGGSAGPFAITITVAVPVPNAGAAVAHGLGQLGQLLSGLPATGSAPADDAVNRARGTAASPPALGGASPGEGGIAGNPELGDDPPDHGGGLPCLTEPERDFLRRRRQEFLALALAAVPTDPGGDFSRANYYNELRREIDKILELYPTCTPEPPPPCVPSSTAGGGMTGMGSAPPPGGSGCGGADAPPPPPAGKPGWRKPAGPGDEQVGRIVVRVFVDGQTVPFSGATDAGGYFFIPFIPQGREFTAVAFDTLTGQSRSLRGIGPETGKSVRLSFDFFAEVPGNVSGTVRDASGPVAGVKVRALANATDELSGQAEATTDASGHYRLPLLPAGTQVLEARSMNHARTIQTLELGDSEVVADFTLTRLSPALRPAHVYVLVSGLQLTDDAVIEALRIGGHVPTRGVDIRDFDGTQANLADFDAVVLLGAYLPSVFDFMPDAGANALIAYVSGGGGVVTSEWVNLNMTVRVPSPLSEIMPVTAGGPQATTTSTYTAAAADAVIDRDVPASFTFTNCRHDGSEGYFTLKAGATSFFDSSATRLPGLVGWDYQLGRAISFSTIIGDSSPVVGEGPLRMFEYQQLFINAVSWAARSAD